MAFPRGWRIHRAKGHAHLETTPFLHASGTWDPLITCPIDLKSTFMLVWPLSWACSPVHRPHCQCAHAGPKGWPRCSCLHRCDGARKQGWGLCVLGVRGGAWASRRGLGTALLSGHVRHRIRDLNLAFQEVMKVHLSWQQAKAYFNLQFVSLMCNSNI